MPTYEVVSRDYSSIHSMVGIEPPEPRREYFIVSAPNARKAKVAAVKFARGTKMCWWDSESPFTGLKARSMNDWPDEDRAWAVADAIKEGYYIVANGDVK